MITDCTSTFCPGNIRSSYRGRQLWCYSSASEPSLLLSCGRITNQRKWTNVPLQWKKGLLGSWSPSLWTFLWTPRVTCAAAVGVGVEYEARRRPEPVQHI